MPADNVPSYKVPANREYITLETCSSQTVYCFTFIMIVLAFFPTSEIFKSHAVCIGIEVNFIY